MLSYQQFSADWKGRTAHCATLAVGAIAVFLSVFLIAQTIYTAIATTQLDEATYGPTISVTGKGKAVAEKAQIIATFTFGATATSESVESAQDESAKVINSAIEFLKSEGIDEKDIETQGYNIYPREEWIPEPCPMGSTYCPGGRYSSIGFQVDQTVRVKVRDTAKAGDILAGVGKKNVTNISGLTFTIDDVDALKDKARAEAIADARERAEKNAEALGVELGDVIGMYESYNPGYPMYGEMGGSYDAYAMKTAPELPVGEQEVEVSVDVQFKIKN